MKKLTGCIFIAIFLFFGFIAFSESIEDNEFYKKGAELLNLAKEEYDGGDYDKGYEDSEQAKEYFTKAHEYNLIMILTIRLNNTREIASGYLEKVKTSGTETTEIKKKYYEDAVNKFNDAETSYNDGKDKTVFQEKGDLFQKAIDGYIESAKLSEMALRQSPDTMDNAQKLLQQARDKRNDLIKLKIIKKADADDLDIMKLIDQSQKFFDGKDYSSSKDKSGEALDLMEKIKLKNEALAFLTEARNMLNQSKEKGAEKDFSDKFNEAGGKIADADKNFSDLNYKESINDSEYAIKILKSFNYKTGDVFPKYYRVRNLRPTADCFWKIASYSFIYNDRTKWKIIYDANKDKLTNANDPNLIYPDILLTIPEISGETRDGEYDSKIKYPEFLKK